MAGLETRTSESFLITSELQDTVPSSIHPFSIDWAPPVGWALAGHGGPGVL